MNEKRTKCLNPTCNRPPYSRGLCDACYQAALRVVARGLTTWEKLIKAGKCKEANHRKTANWLLDDDE